MSITSPSQHFLNEQKAYFWSFKFKIAYVWHSMKMKNGNVKVKEKVKVIIMMHTFELLPSKCISVQSLRDTYLWKFFDTKVILKWERVKSRSKSRSRSDNNDTSYMNFKKTWMKSFKETILDSFFETELKVISTEWMTDFFCWRYINHKKLTFV